MHTNYLEAVIMRKSISYLNISTTPAPVPRWCCCTSHNSIWSCDSPSAETGDPAQPWHSPLWLLFHPAGELDNKITWITIVDSWMLSNMMSYIPFTSSCCCLLSTGKKTTWHTSGTDPIKVGNIPYEVRTQSHWLLVHLAMHAFHFTDLGTHRTIHFTDFRDIFLKRQIASSDK